MVTFKQLTKPTYNIVLLLYGLFYTVLPHSVHTKYALDWVLANRGIIETGFPHQVHVTLGLILLIIAFVRAK